MQIRCESCKRSFEYEENLTHCPYCGEEIKNKPPVSKTITQEKASSPVTLPTNASRILAIISVFIFIMTFFAFFGQAYEGANDSLFNLLFHPSREIAVGTETVKKSYAGITVGFIIYALAFILAIVALINIINYSENGVLTGLIVIALALGLFFLIYLSAKSVDHIDETKNFWGEVVTPAIDTRMAFGLGGVSLLVGLFSSAILGIISKVID